MSDCMERVKGIEPSPQAWEAGILPLNYTRIDKCMIYYKPNRRQDQDVWRIFKMFSEFMEML